MKRTALALLSATLGLATGSDVQLLPAGEFKGRSGRPGAELTWKVTDAVGARVAALLNARHGAGAQFHFDYDHQTLFAASNGQKAPAAGWAAAFEWRPGQGLYALNVDWTAVAKGEIADKQFRYVSPVLEFNPANGEVLDVKMAALTNYPDLTHMSEVPLAALNALFHQESDVNLLQQLLAKLGLAADTTEAAALSAVESLQAAATAAKARPAVPAAIATALGVDAAATETVALSAIEALRKPATVDATTLSTITALQGQIAALTAAQNERDLQQVITDAVAAGKLLPAQIEWATAMGKKDIAALNAFVASAPVVAAGLGKPQAEGGAGGAGGAGKDGLTESELAICNALSLTPEQFKKGAAAAAA